MHPSRHFGASLLTALLTLIPATTQAQDDTFVADSRAHLAKLEKLGFAGVVLIARDGVPLLAEGYGLADRERGVRWTPATVSSVGSITKQFTAAAILALEEEGRLKVEDTLGKYFADVPTDKQAITLHQLLTHSSGIVDLDGAGDWDPIGREEFVRRALAQPLAFALGTGYEYSNAGYSLLGAIIEQLTGGSWEQFARKRLFLPQAMYETGYILAPWGDGRLAQGYREGERWGTVLERPMAADGPYWVLRANGGVHTTAWDMLRWTQALLDGRVLSPASMQKLWAPHVKEPGDTFYGYGWSIQQLGDVKVVTHDGSNGIHYANYAIVPAQRIVALLQTNVIADVPVGRQLLGQIGNRLLGGQPYPAVPNAITLPAAEIEALAGLFQLPDGMGALRLTAQEGRLLAEAEGRQAFTLLHSSRRIDTARAARLDEQMKAIATAALAGDFEPMRQARGDDVPASRLAERYGQWREEQEAALGKLAGFDVVGTAFQEGRDVTLVRFRFEQGTVDRAFVWDSDAETRLLGISVRGLKTEVEFIPTGADTFGSWDGGVSASRPLTFVRDSEGRLRATLGGPEGGLTMVR